MLKFIRFNITHVKNFNIASLTTDTINKFARLQSHSHRSKKGWFNKISLYYYIITNKYYYYYYYCSFIISYSILTIYAFSL